MRITCRSADQTQHLPYPGIGEDHSMATTCKFAGSGPPLGVTIVPLV
jgi:hypothetical protein